MVMRINARLRLMKSALLRIFAVLASALFALPGVAMPTPILQSADAAEATPAPEPPPEPRLPLPASFDVRTFEAMAEAVVAGQKVPGLALAITHRGRVLSARGYGITDVNTAEPVDAHTVFRLASLSKSFAGTVTGLLVDEGPLRWDSRVVDFLPTLQLSAPDAIEHLTVADLLSHRIGLKPHAYDKDIEANAEFHTLLERFPQAPMACAPGECYGYQNVAFSLVADVVFAASGQFYPEAVRRRIFQPLGMHDASLGLDGILASPRWARPHIAVKGGGWRSLTPKPTYYRLAPAAGVNASISDMAQWVIAQAGHRPDVLPPPLLDTLHSPLVETPGELRTRSTHWRGQRLNSAAYGLGWRVYDYAGRRLIYHGGAVQGYRSAMAILPERELGVVILWNSSSALPSGLLPTILDHALDLPAPPQRWLEVELPSEQQHARDDTPAPPADATDTGSTATPPD